MRSRSASQDQDLMWRQLLPATRQQGASLQSRLRRALVAAILDRRLLPGTRLPSTRHLAGLLGVSRNTVTLTITELVDDGYLGSRPRSGYFVAARDATEPVRERHDDAPSASAVDWSARIDARPLEARWLDKLPDWQRYRYPFVFGQIDRQQFPIAAWREASKLALSVNEVYGWSSDVVDQDHEHLVEQLVTRVLPRRGLAVRPSQIMLTVGSQQALYLLAELLVAPGTPVGVEDPGYIDARVILQRRQAALVGLAVDHDGVLPERLERVRYLYCTPSHQYPTGATMSTARRIELLREAARHDVVLIEDDYDAEIQFSGQPLPALKALDRDERVIYLGSLSKLLAPGLRIGYLVGPEPLIARARQLRRLMIRHPPANNQRALAVFIALGHYDRLIRRTRALHAERAAALADAVTSELPDFAFTRPQGGSSIWVTAPRGLTGERIFTAALRREVIVEPGLACHLAADAGAARALRLAYSSIDATRIGEGIRQLALAVRGCR